MARASFGFLHLTDLHIGSGGLQTDWPTIEADLIDDLGHVYELSGPWDFVAFTGDLAFKGDASEYRAAQSILDKLWAKFRGIGCDPQLISVPGNHDLARPPKEFARSLLRRWSDVRTRQDFFGADAQGLRATVLASFAEYQRWWNKLEHSHRRAPGIRVPPVSIDWKGELPGDFTATIAKDGFSLGLLGLNTTFLQLSDQVKEGQLGVEAEQIRRAAGGHLPNWKAEHDACLLLTHQPPSWLSEQARANLTVHAVHPLWPLVHLYGHMHEPHQLFESHDGGRPRLELQGAALFGLEGWGSREEDRIHGYSACRLEFTEKRSTLRLWPRRMSLRGDGGLEFRADPDYDFPRGKEEIEPIERRLETTWRPRGTSVAARFARALTKECGIEIWQPEDFDAGLSTSGETGVELSEAIDLWALRDGLLPGLQREFTNLASEFTAWLETDVPMAAGRRLRVFWLVGDDVPHRNKGLLACLANAGRDNGVVGDAGREVNRAIEALEWCIQKRVQGLRALIGVEFDDDGSALVSPTIRVAAQHARRAARAGVGSLPLLVIAGTGRQARDVFRALSAVIEITAVNSTGARERLDKDPVPDRSEHVFNRGLPITSGELFGRETDLQRLRDAWNSRDTRVLSLVAFGGTGKSALVNAWLREMEEHGYRSADRVLAWSFYSQGTKENLVSADEFVRLALDWLGGENVVTLSPSARGAELAARIKAHGRFLLVLDGVEPLQHPPEAPEVGGRLTDDSIWTLIEHLAKPDWDGLCIITTRVGLTDLRDLESGGSANRGTVERLELRNLEIGPAAQLLKHLIGRDPGMRALEEVVREVKGHALAVTLLGHYLRDVHAGDLNGRFDLERMTKAERDGGHARRVMASYARWFEQRSRSAELAILHLIGLFDRPAEPAALEALVADVQLGPLMSDVERVGSDTWNRAADGLRRIALLNEPFPDEVGVIDAHPLVREHFREELRTKWPDMWTLGNRRLFEYYHRRAPSRPDNAKDMQSLYASVLHGCEAGLYQDVFDEVLVPRVWRDARTNFSTRHLGLTGADLVALSNYFQDRRWTHIKDVTLTPDAQVLIRTNAGVRLRQLGRLRDARNCFSAVVSDIAAAQTDREALSNAAYAAAQDCELLVIEGKLNGAGGKDPSALRAGERAVEYADRAGEAYFSMHARSSLAEVHFMLGHADEAGSLFAAAQEIDRERHPSPPFLYSQSLFRYGYYLIESGRGNEIQADAARTPDWGTNGTDSSLLSRAIRLLILGAARRAAIEDGEEDVDFVAQTARILDEAHGQFRAAGYPDYVVRGLLERAHFRRIRHHPDDYGDAIDDLVTAGLEAQRAQMDLLYTDVLLQRAACELRFWGHMGSGGREVSARSITTSLGEAGELISRHRYHRRDGMVAQLRELAAAAGIRR